MQVEQDKEVSTNPVEDYFPVYKRNQAPFISFDGEQGISLQMKPVKAFQESDTTEPTLFSYVDSDTFIPSKVTPPSPISWPSGDGRGVPMSGTEGSFTQPNLKEYGPFPDFFKRSCDS